MNIRIPNMSLVLLMGCTGSGKSTFAKKHFKPTEVLSSDFCRGLVSDDENNQSSSDDAFNVLHYIAGKRLARGLLTVVDATNVQPESRKPLIQLAREHDVLPVAIVLNVSEKVCYERNQNRPDRDFGTRVIRSHSSQLRRSLRGLGREGFRHVFELRSVDDVEAAMITREPLWNDKRSERGPFDIIGDIHGCYDELHELLLKLGYAPTEDGSFTPPAGRKAIFVGDLVDRGPGVARVLKLAMSMCRQGTALCVPGNHDVKLMRKLFGKDVQITHGLAESLLQLELETPQFREDVGNFIDSLVSHYVLSDGRLVVAHAGMKEAYQGRGSQRVREFALYGETTGETDEFGLPVRHNWAAEYRGDAEVVYGHTPVVEADWLNRTINIDTGCVFGSKLTALRWPEREILSVPAKHVYSEPIKPLALDVVPPLSIQQQADDLLDIEDVIGKRIVTTRLMQNVTVREENAIAALEVMSRFAANPKWLIYLPPTMSPCETSAEQDLLEHPREAFAYYRHHGIAEVVCQKKHMGSRAVVTVCRDEEAARRRFGVVGEGSGIVITRTGRKFFDDADVEAQLVSHVASALTKANFWDEFQSDWFCLDCELMPWSAKAQELLKNQYAPVGNAGEMSLDAAVAALQQAAARGVDVSELSTRFAARRETIDQYVRAYERYCWSVSTVSDLRLAPFQLLASEKQVHVAKDHVWQMQTLARLAESGGTPLMSTDWITVKVTEPESIERGIQWWLDITAAGGEGMVVKPHGATARGPKGLVQPAVKCRGREYLRIIYGPEYTNLEHLSRLRFRHLASKRSLAAREFALGVESLERFVRREPLRRVHECVFAVLALESEPVDPRL